MVVESNDDNTAPLPLNNEHAAAAAVTAAVDPELQVGEGENNNATTTTTVGVCCGCFAPRRQRYRRTTYGGVIPPPATLQRRETIYHDALQDSSCSQAESSQAYFDAVEDLLLEDDYPTIPTVSIPKRLHKVSMVQPESLLRPKHLPSRQQQDDYEAKKSISFNQRNMLMASITSHGGLHGPGRKSLKNKVFRRGSFLAQQELEKPRIALSERGYPGQLNSNELEQCLHFYREIHKQPEILEIVYCFAKVEEEPYGICRFMRATKFDANAILNRLQQGIPIWQQVKAQQFYPNLHQAIGVPLPLFLEMYPFFYHGNAKNGCPVNYFKAGKINAEGLLCCSTVDHAPRYYWHLFYYTFQDMIKRAKQKNENFVRCEAINVVDLKGMSSSQMTSETMDVMKKVAVISNFFPETLHCMVILNAPAWFGMTWPIIKSFIDPRTAKKIEVYSREAAGKARLAELIEASEIPADYGGTAPPSDVLMNQNKESNDEKKKSSGDGGDPGKESVGGGAQVERVEHDEEEKDCRRAVDVVFLKKNEIKKIDNFIQVKKGEVVKIQVYTRSITAANVSVTMITTEGGDNEDATAGNGSTPSGNNNNNSSKYLLSRSTEAENVVNITNAPVHVGRDNESLSEYTEENMPRPFTTEICQNIAGPGTINVEIKDASSSNTAAAHIKLKLSQGYFLIVATVTTTTTESTSNSSIGVESSPARNEKS